MKNGPPSGAAPARPDPVASAAEAVGRSAFTLSADLVEAQFHRRAPVLFVTFDNLGTVGEYDPPQPWMHVRLAQAGFSILGLIAHRKDWYRNADTPRLITELHEAGLFDGFERIVFTGTSMGGYAALTYARLVPGAEVLAFSPQTTLNRRIAPFERRFPYALRKWDWKTPDFLDAAETVPQAARIHLLYDPFVPEDRAHAMRLQGANVQHIKCRHFGHKLIRQIKGCGALERLISAVGDGKFDARGFQQDLRARRGLRPWGRAFMADVLASGQPRRAQIALDCLVQTDPGAPYLKKARETLDRRDGPTSAT